MNVKVDAIKIPAEEITVDDCIDLYARKGYAAICNDGQLDGFVREEDSKRSKKKLKFIWLH